MLPEAQSFTPHSAHGVLALITSARNSDWPLDVPITDLDTAGLPSASMVRLKLFTLDDQLVIRKAGALAPKDRKAVTKALQKLLPQG